MEVLRRYDAAGRVVEESGSVGRGLTLEEGLSTSTTTWGLCAWLRVRREGSPTDVRPTAAWPRTRSASRPREGRTYSARGDLREERFGNGLVATREYQPGTGRLTRQLVRRSTTRLQDWTYGHDANGRVTSRRDALNSFQETYDFDPLGRLTKVTSSHDPTLSLQYDVIGNLTWASDVGTLSYDGTSKPHAVRGFRGVEQQYDSVGNHLGDATRRRVEYNALDLPNNILRRADGRSIQIRYDAEGNRAATHGPDGDRYYLGPVEMRGGVFVHRVQVGGRTVAQAMRKDGTTRVDVAYVHDDHLGSTDLVTDVSGNVQARFSYDAWGARKTRSWTRAPAGPDGTPLVDHGYTGHEHDDEWGVIHMRGRAYDPAMRRMTGVDPFVVNPFGVQAFNRYSYVLNDPINLTNPSGYSPESGQKLSPPRSYCDTVTSGTCLSPARVGSSVQQAIPADGAPQSVLRPSVHNALDRATERLTQNPGSDVYGKPQDTSDAASAGPVPGTRARLFGLARQNGLIQNGDPFPARTMGTILCAGRRNVTIWQVVPEIHPDGRVQFLQPVQRTFRAGVSVTIASWRTPLLPAAGR